MNRPIIRLSSVTYAIRAQKLLEQRGIKSYIKKLTREIGRHGCGYGLEVAGNAEVAAQIISAADIRVLEVYGGGMP